MFLLMRKICRIGGACLARGVRNLVGHGHDGNITTARTAGSRDVREAEPVQARQLPIVAACQRREWRVRGPLLLRAKGHHAEGQCCARIGVATICRADEPSRSVVGLCLSKYQSIASSLVPTPLRAIFSCAR